MEYQLAGATQDHLLDSLDLSLAGNKTANYVTSRRSTSFYPAGAGTFSSDGVRVLRINLTGLGDAWLDPTTLRLQCQIRNTSSTDNTVLEPVAGPHCFFDRVRLLAQGTVVEDVMYYHRTHQMLMDTLVPHWQRYQEDVQGFGTSVTDSLGATGGGDPSLEPVRGYIPEGQALTVLMKPCLGFILGSTKMIPLRHMPLQLEFWLADKANVFKAGNFTTGGTTYTRRTTYELTDCKILCDVLTLDSRLENSFSKIMLSGKSLVFSHPVYHTTMQSVLGDKPTIALTRALTRLRGLFISFTKIDDNERTTFRYPKSAGNTLIGRIRHNRPLQLLVQLGSKKYPEAPISSTAEFYEHLRKALHIHNNIYGDLSLDLKSFESNKFIIGISTEKVIGSTAAFSGLNTRTGDLLCILLQGMYSAGDTETVDRIYVTYVADQVVTLTEQGVGVYD